MGTIGGHHEDPNGTWGPNGDRMKTPRGGGEPGGSYGDPKRLWGPEGDTVKTPQAAVLWEDPSSPLTRVAVWGHPLCPPPRAPQAPHVL